LTRNGGLPVHVSPEGFKMTFVLSNWTWFNSSVTHATLDLDTNVLTQDIPYVELNYPDMPGTTDPVSFTATVANKWSFSMHFERWTLFNGNRTFNGKVLPKFPGADEDGYLQRNQRNITIIYTVPGVYDIEYDPTGFFSVFNTDMNPKGEVSRRKSPPYWIIGVVLGVIALAALIAILAVKVPVFKAIIRPFSQRPSMTSMHRETSK
jgi:hypothetical protein